MRFFLILSAFCFLAAPAFAQKSGDMSNVRKSKAAEAEVLQGKFQESYDTVLESIYGMPDDLKSQIWQLRSYYPRTKNYTAFSDGVKDEMVHLSFQAKNETDVVKSKAALMQYNTLLKQHFASLEILMLAAGIAQEDVTFGDPVFLSEAADIMYKIVTENADGLTPATAIKILSFGEEDIFLKRLAKGKLIKSDLYDRNGAFINVHQVENAKNGKVTKYYFDISTPIVESSKKQKEAEKKVSRRF